MPNEPRTAPEVVVRKVLMSSVLMEEWWPTRPGGTGPNGGYRRTCGDHMRAALREQRLDR